MKGMECVMQHMLTYPDHGMVIQPDGEWDGSREFEFKIDGILDSEDVTEPELCKCYGDSKCL